ncbi:MAG: alkene reductase [Alphaproteobacteria bacterium]
MSTLFDPITLGELDLRNRIIMAPLTRTRATADTRVPTDLMVEYYRQRASAGMILTEATSVSPMGVGYPRTPGIWSDEQVAGWRKITDAVHQEGGKILLQLWHVGRVSHSTYLDGALPHAPSAVQSAGHVSLMRPKAEYETPHAMTEDEITATIAAYRTGAENAKKAGFDGVEIHGANGYLIDQFLQDKTNKRTDQWGGSIENRARFMLAVTDAVLEVWSPGRVGMHLAPRADAHDMGDSDLTATFSYVAEQLGKRNLAFIATREHVAEDSIGPILREEFGGKLIANEGLTKQTGETLIETGKADAVAYGQLFIANPDLPERFASDAPLNEPDPSTYYSVGAEGYTDYPALALPVE